MSAVNPITVSAFAIIAVCYGLTLVNAHRKDEVIEKQAALIEKQNVVLERANSSMTSSIDAMQKSNAALDELGSALSSCRSMLWTGSHDASEPPIVVELSTDGIASDALAEIVQ